MSRKIILKARRHGKGDKIVVRVEGDDGAAEGVVFSPEALQWADGSSQDSWEGDWVVHREPMPEVIGKARQCGHNNSFEDFAAAVGMLAGAIAGWMDQFYSMSYTDPFQPEPEKKGPKPPEMLVRRNQAVRRATTRNMRPLSVYPHIPAKRRHGSRRQRRG